MELRVLSFSVRSIILPISLTFLTKTCFWKKCCFSDILNFFVAAEYMEEILPVFWFGFVNLATSDVVGVCLSCAVCVIIVFQELSA
jgi:hypothetical protein